MTQQRPIGYQGRTPQASETMALGGNNEITGDSGLGGLLKVASPIINNVLKKNSTDTDYVPFVATIK